MGFDAGVLETGNSTVMSASGGPEDRDRSAEAAEGPTAATKAPRKAAEGSFEEDLEHLAGQASQPAARAEPVEFGPYKLIERVAVGGMAEVFRAKLTGVEGFEKVVAVKRILPHLSDHPDFVEMFVHEAKVVAGLSHPNIVQIFDLGRIGASYYIAMEYVEGHDLRTTTNRARERGLRLPVDLALRIAGQVCAALDYAHRRRDEAGQALEIVHRDVSPPNILLSFEGEVKLADFGIARAATRAPSTGRGVLRGKVLYMSPEQAWGRPLDGRSDVFSLGAVLYELVTGTKALLSAGGDRATVEAVRECAIAPAREINPRLPEAVERLLMKALAREPDERFQDAAQMQRAIEHLLAERPPVTARDLSRFMQLAFDPAAPTGEADGSSSNWSSSIRRS
jgi:serine/threonine protein kinase